MRYAAAQSPVVVKFLDRTAIVSNSKKLLRSLHVYEQGLKRQIYIHIMILQSRAQNTEGADNHTLPH
jgi:hypothetical protein